MSHELFAAVERYQSNLPINLVASMRRTATKLVDFEAAPTTPREFELLTTIELLHGLIEQLTQPNT